MNRERGFIFTVRQLTQYLKTLLSQDRTLQDIRVRGEIGDLTRHTSGHIYFTLKDEFSQLRCVMFREEANALSFIPESGAQVVARGTISLYELRGQYQLVVRELAQAGVGELSLAFERLRNKLAAEGLFDENRKRPLPLLPHKIAVITSPVGAAFHDILTMIRTRCPSCEIVLIPAPVSGAAAATGITRSLELLSSSEGAEVAVLARGGGSMEELSGFNSEQVARAIAASPIPIVTGIGHETDFTIADFVADLRAPTPTAAAAAVIPDRRELQRRILTYRQMIGRRLERLFSRYHRELELLRMVLGRNISPALLAERRQRLDDAVIKLRQSLVHNISDLQQRLMRAREKLKALSPNAVLSRGYSITRLPSGKIVHSVGELVVGGAFEVILYDGSAEAVVQKLRN